MALKVIVYVFSALYGFVITFYGMRWLRQFFFQSIRKGSYNPWLSALYMFFGGILIALPAFYNVWAFLASFFVSMITNILSLLLLSKKPQSIVQQKKEISKE